MTNRLTGITFQIEPQQWRFPEKIEENNDPDQPGCQDDDLLQDLADFGVVLFTESVADDWCNSTGESPETAHEHELDIIDDRVSRNALFSADMEQHLVGDERINGHSNIGQEGRKSELCALPKRREKVGIRFCEMDLTAFPAEKDDADDEYNNVGNQVRIGAACHTETELNDEQPVKEKVAEGIDQCDIERHPGVTRRNVKPCEDVIDEDQRNEPDANRKESFNIGEKDLRAAKENDKLVQKNASDQ